jgi:Mn-dependent DtxR family transcriptional regulator
VLVHLVRRGLLDYDAGSYSLTDAGRKTLKR